MIDQLFVSQYPVKGRFRGQIDAHISKFRNNLIRRQIPIFRSVGYFQNFLSFLFSQFIGRRLLWTISFINAIFTETPSDDCPGAETNDLRSRRKTGTSFQRFVDKFQDYFPFFGGMPSSSSPQIAWAFFFNTSNAAVSANALSLRLTSFSSCRMRLASADLPFDFFLGLEP